MSDTISVNYFGKDIAIPSWARWVATDKISADHIGTAWAYESMPVPGLNGSYWVSSCGRKEAVSRVAALGFPAFNTLMHTDLIKKREEKESDIVIGGVSLLERDMRVLPDKLSLYRISAGMPLVDGQPDRPIAQRVMAEGIYPAVMGYASGQVEDAHVMIGVNYYITSTAASDLKSNEYAVFHFDENMNIQWGRAQ